MTRQVPAEARQSSFSRDLERRARELVRHAGADSSPITTMLIQNIALALEQLDSLRVLHRDQLRGLTRSECYVDTEIMQLEQDMPRYAPLHSPERDKLHQRLFLIEAERRKAVFAHYGQLRGLQQHLLSLIQKHEQMEGSRSGTHQNART